jgi:hypothetical protein
VDPITGQGALTEFINLATKKVVMPCFYKIGLFDPVSHLAYAEAHIGKDKDGLPVFRKGYVNEDGLFVLIMGQGPPGRTPSTFVIQNKNYRKKFVYLLSS